MLAASDRSPRRLSGSAAWSRVRASAGRQRTRAPSVVAYAVLELLGRDPAQDAHDALEQRVEALYARWEELEEKKSQS